MCLNFSSFVLEELLLQAQQLWTADWTLTEWYHISYFFKKTIFSSGPEVLFQDYNLF